MYLEGNKSIIYSHGGSKRGSSFKREAVRKGLKGRALNEEFRSPRSLHDYEYLNHSFLPACRNETEANWRWSLAACVDQFIFGFCHAKRRPNCPEYILDDFRGERQEFLRLLCRVVQLIFPGLNRLEYVRAQL